tara:strand:- start:399 stop:734 length:336 start_codon:yes stop_codon:yes gene_type:complete
MGNPAETDAHLTIDPSMIDRDDDKITDGQLEGYCMTQDLSPQGRVDDMVIYSLHGGTLTFCNGTYESASHPQVLADVERAIAKQGAQAEPKKLRNLRAYEASVMTASGVKQ